MLLNRSLVVQFPSYGVPWFHENYCLDNLNNNTLIYIQNSSLKNEVYEELCSAVGGWVNVRTNSYSRYYNPIHMEVLLDQQGNPINLNAPTPVDADTVWKRIAVQVYDEIDYTQDTRRLGGELVHNNLQLMLQGWQVITINPFSWNSMYLSDSAARQQYLHDTVQAMAA